jgi:hypothetical protein
MKLQSASAERAQVAVVCMGDCDPKGLVESFSGAFDQLRVGIMFLPRLPTKVGAFLYVL